jgi:copper transport protein
MTSHRMRGLLSGVLLGMLTVLFTPATPASAHAVVTAASPAQGAVVGAAPSAVLVSFNEPVRVIPGRTQVIAPDGKRINTGDPVASGTTLSIALREPARPLGTYVVSYRVISADSHPLSGAFTFSVGAPSQTPAQDADAGVHPAVRAAVTTAKYLGYAGLVLVIGPILILAVLWPWRLPRRAPLRLVWIGLSLLTGSTLASLWLQAPAASGAAPFDVTVVELRQVMASQFGVVLLCRLAAIAVAAALLGPVLRRNAGRPVRIALGVLGVAGLATWPLAGHQIASPQPVISAVAGVVHLAGMAVWLGGLVILVGFLLRRADPRELRIILPAWSRWAAHAVSWLIAAGVIQALIEVGAPRTLLDTGYGQLLLIKVALLTGVVALAAYSRRLVQRHIAASSPHRLRRTVWAELGVTAVVLAASSVLAQTTPSRTAGIEAAAVAQARGFSTTLNSSLYAVQFEVFPAELGEYNTLHAFAYTPEGKPLNVAEWKVTASLPEQGIEPMANPVAPLLGNQGLGAVNFPVPGKWQLRLTLRTSETDQATVTTTITVKPKP